MCLTESVQVWYFTSSSLEQLIASFPQNAARVGTFSDSVPHYYILERLLLQVYAARVAVLDRLYPRLSFPPLRAEDSSLKVSLKALHALAALVALPQRIPDPDSRLYQVAQCAETCTTTHSQDWNPSPSSLEQFSQTLPQSAVPARELCYLDSMSRQYRQAPSRTVTLRGHVCSPSRWSTLSDQQQAPHDQFGIVFLVQRSTHPSLRLERTEDSPDLSWEEMIRRRCGSTRGYAQSDDLEPRARHSGAAARQAGGVATCVPQPQPHTLNSTHTHLASIARPRHLIRSPSNSARVSSICGMTHPQ